MISQDPAGFIDGPNLYAYLHNNPLNYLDRFGLITEQNSQNKFDGYMYGEFETHCHCEKHRTCKRGGDIGITSGPQLPKIRYSDHFEEFYSNYTSEDKFWETVDLYEKFRPYFERSKLYSLSDQGLPELTDLAIGFINGIDTSYEAAKENAMYLSRLAGGCNIHAVYNATHGITVDLKECEIGLRYIATDPVRQLHKMWDNFFEKNSVNANFLQVCHSQGAIHVRNALLDYPSELQKRISVVAIAPGGYIYPESCAQVMHYRAKISRDFIPYFDQQGSARAQGTIFELNSHLEAPLHDHSFKSPTYLNLLNQSVTRYIQNKGKLL